MFILPVKSELFLSKNPAPFCFLPVLETDTGHNKSADRMASVCHLIDAFIRVMLFAGIIGTGGEVLLGDGIAFCANAGAVAVKLSRWRLRDSSLKESFFFCVY